MFKKFSDHVPDDDTEKQANVEFYRNIRVSKPSGDTIENIHANWFGNHRLLEQHHGFIQWLFPIREIGMNSSAQPLSKAEAEEFRANKHIQQRLIMSYRLMLDFYGMVLIDEQTGEVARNPETFRNCYYNLNTSSHNFLRVTRILKCLGMCGFEQYKMTLLRHFIMETFQHGQLSNIQTSLIRFWMPTLRRREELKYLDNFVETLSNGKRKINRNGQDGWGDERGDNWSTQVYPSAYTFDLNNPPPCLTRQSVLTADRDPFPHLRSNKSSR